MVVARTEGKTWSGEKAAEFYVEHKGKAFFDELVAFMSSGPLVELCLEKVRPCAALRRKCESVSSSLIVAKLR